ncbi:hypothetical protein SAMN04488542_11214 [Fontibacillus panacisegetis]|uniref:DUF5050 domain-containing protein n=1 Tax=Fontibacillus panacisegetis TaxID=670482 RepID=A0A1G7LP75_9BACL|nr:hypothetical protein [Fontibacillus panacisegetis]SDF51295.1 hypothetical protein SAMN04488542_11214 [Fontibacillus panacisegetis]
MYTNSRNKKYGRAMLLMIIASLLLAATPVFGAGTYQTKDRKVANSTQPSYNFRISGDRFVFIEKDKAGIPQVYLRSVKTGKLEQITNSNTFKTSIRIKGDDIFFLESTIPVTKNINVYRKNIIQYNLKTKETQQLLDEGDYPEYLNVDGNYLVYSTSHDGYTIINLKTKQTKVLDKSYKVMDIVDGKLLVRQDYPDYTLSTYDIATDKVTSVVTMKDNQEFHNAAFNGKYVIWFTETQTRLDPAKKKQYLNAYTIVDLTKPNAQQKTINLSSSIHNAPNQLLSVGTNYVAWTEKVNDKHIARGMDLRTGNIFNYGDMNKNQSNFLYFVGDELLMQDDAGNISLRSVVR